MRVAVVTYGIHAGGVETFLGGLSRFFESEGHETAFVETTSRGCWADQFERDGFRVIDILPGAIRSRLHHAQRIAAALRNFDVVILNDVPYAQSILGLLPSSTARIAVLHNPLLSMVETVLGNAAECDCIVAVSPGLRDLLVHGFGVDPARVTAICNGIEVPNTWPKNTVDMANGGCLKIACVGRIEHRQKGVFLLPEILQRVSAQGCEVRLTVIGDGSDRMELERRLASISLKGGTVFCGLLSHRETLHVLKEQDVLIMPSFYEGLPIALLEAMNLGVVPVVSRLQGRTDAVVQNGESGYLVQPGDIGGYAEVVCELATHHDRLREMSLHAWQRVRDRFNIGSVGDAYLKLFEASTRQRGEHSNAHVQNGVDVSLLGDLPRVPIVLVRPLRKLLRTIGMWDFVRVSQAIDIPATVAMSENGLLELVSCPA